MHDSKTHTRAHTHREKYVQRNIDFNKNKTKNTKNVHTRIWSTNYRLNSRFIKPLQCVVQAIFHSNNDQTLTIRLFVLVYSVLVCLCRLVVVFFSFSSSFPSWCFISYHQMCKHTTFRLYSINLSLSGLLPFILFMQLSISLYQREEQENPSLIFFSIILVAFRPVFFSIHFSWHKFIGWKH